jgi:hypothetical protein
MSEFRIPITSRESHRELDWDGDKWTLSEKDFGFGQSWVEHLSPSETEKDELLSFFRVDRDTLSHDVDVFHLSPSDLTLIHQNIHEQNTVYANICTKCGQHWHIYRWDFQQNSWLVYGRNCDYSWRKGEELTKEENEYPFLKKYSNEILQNGLKKNQ